MKDSAQRKKHTKVALVAVFMCAGVFAPWYEAAGATSWILWQKFITIQSMGDADWEVVSATDSKDDCMARIRYEFQAHKVGLGKPKSEDIVGTDAAITWYVSNKLLEYDYLCLPETVDPRRGGRNHDRK